MRGKKKVLAMVLAGGPGGRMGVLTGKRAKPALPYAGVYRLVDFPMSNCMHSGISDVWVVEQYKPQSLNDQLSNGRPWDLDRTYGGLRLLPPYQGGDESGWHQGNADAIHRNKVLIREFDPDILVVLSADHIYKLDYSDVIEHHLAREADVTVVTTKVPLEEAGRFGTVGVDERGSGRVTDFEYKPDSPKWDLATTEVFVYDARKLLATLEELAALDEAEEGEDDSLEDYGDGLLPRMVENGRAYEYRLEGYWRDVGTVESYWSSHMDLLLAPAPPIVLDDPAWPIYTLGLGHPPARIFGTAGIEDALISPGCTVRGRVIRSVLAPGVVVEEGAVVRDSIVLHGATIGPGAAVVRAIVDANVTVGEGAEIGGSEARESSDSEISVVGEGARIPAGARVAPGDHVEPGSTAKVSS